MTRLTLHFSRQEINYRIFCTAYMGMEKNSSAATRKRAADLSKAIGASHLDFDIDPVYDAQVKLLQSVTGFEPKFKMYGGTKVSNLALQNIQARTRMINAYALAQLLPQIRGRREGASGSLLVLGSANISESLRGCMFAQFSACVFNVSTVPQFSFLAKKTNTDSDIM
jgi:NAD+ synthase (glutamine-hydrolysing)